MVYEVVEEIALKYANSESVYWGIKWKNTKDALSLFIIINNYKTSIIINKYVKKFINHFLIYIFFKANILINNNTKLH